MKLKLLAFLVLANVALIAQNKTENLSMGSGYSNDLYYSLDSGLVKSEPRNNWHIAFTTKIVDASILINDVSGTTLYLGSTDTTDWSSLDTTGNSWLPLYNSEEVWEEGAFNDGAAGHPDYGWGTYNSVTHNVSGTKIFVIKVNDSTYKKMIIDNMKTNGDFEFRIANLDGTNMLTKVLNKKTFSDINFMYYNVLTDSLFSREPNKTSWDFVFTKYNAVQPNGAWYPVTGVKQNSLVKSSRARGVDTTMVDYNNYPISDTAINIIGFDWKEFDMNSFSWVIEDSLSYFTESKVGNLYKVVFKTWSGSTTGDFSFSTALISAISVPEISKINMVVYPNPAQDFVQIKSNLNLDIEIYNLSGSVVKTTKISGNGKLNIADLSSGTYILRAVSAKGIYQSKLIIQ